MIETGPPSSSSVAVARRRHRRASLTQSGGGGGRDHSPKIVANKGRRKVRRASGNNSSSRRSSVSSLEEEEEGDLSSSDDFVDEDEEVQIVRRSSSSDECEVFAEKKDHEGMKKTRKNSATASSLQIKSNGLSGPASRRARTHSNTEETATGRRGSSSSSGGSASKEHIRRRRTHSHCVTEEVFVVSEGGGRTRRSSLAARLSSNKVGGSHSNKDDDEVSFSDPLSLDDAEDPLSSTSSPILNGLLTGKHPSSSSSSTAKRLHRLPYDQRPMPASKKKRKSSDEKFLEDNSDYYGIKVLPTKLRSDHGQGGGQGQEEQASKEKVIFGWPSIRVFEFDRNRFNRISRSWQLGSDAWS